MPARGESQEGGGSAAPWGSLGSSSTGLCNTTEKWVYSLQSSDGENFSIQEDPRQQHWLLRVTRVYRNSPGAGGGQAAPDPSPDGVKAVWGGLQQGRFQTSADTTRA